MPSSLIEILGSEVVERAPDLVEVLNRHRGKGQQKVTVEHVQVNAGGQAIVGNIESPRRLWFSLTMRRHIQRRHSPARTLGVGVRRLGRVGCGSVDKLSFTTSVMGQRKIAGLSTLLPRGGSSKLPSLCGAPFVTMMEAAQHGNRDDPARLRRLDRPRLWAVFVQR